MSSRHEDVKHKGSRGEDPQNTQQEETRQLDSRQLKWRDQKCHIPNCGRRDVPLQDATENRRWKETPGSRATDQSKVIFITWKMLLLKAMLPRHVCDMRPGCPDARYGFRESLLLKADSTCKSLRHASAQRGSFKYHAMEFWREFTYIRTYSSSITSFGNLHCC